MYPRAVPAAASRGGRANRLSSEMNGDQEIGMATTRSRPRTSEPGPPNEADEGDEERLPQGEPEQLHEQRARGEDEEPGAEAGPEHEEVERPQDAEGIGDGFHPPFRGPPQPHHRRSLSKWAITRWRSADQSGFHGVLCELLVRIPQGGDERQLLPGKEIDQRAAAGAHVVDPILEPELLDRRDRVASSDDGEPVGLRDRSE